MQWWNEFVNWIQSTDGHRSVFFAVVVLLAVVVGVLISAAALRGSIARLVRKQERDLRNSVIATLVDAATEASVWNSLTPAEQVLNDRAVGQADIHLRMLPLKGAGTTASWVAHELAELKRNSATFGYQLEPAVAEFRDRLLHWLDKPARARKAFAADLERWAAVSTAEEADQVAKQEAWVAKQHHDKHVAAQAQATTPAPAAASPAPTSPPADDAAPAVAAPATVPAASAASSATDESAPFRAPASAPTTHPAEPSTATAQTSRLLADVEALEVRPAAKEPVEEFPETRDRGDSPTR